MTICISVLSIGLSCVYAGSRTLTALAETGYAPRIFTYIDKAGRPLPSLIFIMLFSPLAYINCADVGGQVFNWLVALSGLSTLFTWLAICVTHIRFRRAWKVQGHSVEELPFKALGGTYGSWVGASLIVLVLIAQFYIVSFYHMYTLLSGERHVLTVLQALFPLSDPETPNERAEGFFRE